MAKAENRDRATALRCKLAARGSLEHSLSSRYRAPLMAFFNRRTGNFGEAEDLAQEVLVRVLQRSDLGDVENPDAFIFKTARNLLRDRARHEDVRRKNQIELEIREDGTEGVNPERVIQGKQELARAMGALAELKERTRDIFILNRLEGMKYREIAELYGMSVSGVEKHLIRAFAHMIEQFEE